MAITSALSLDFEKVLNPVSATAAADVVRLANGGFAVIGDAGGGIHGTLYDAAGTITGNWGGTTGTDGAIAQLDNGNLVTVSENAGRIVYRIVNSTTGAEVRASENTPVPNSSNADVAAFTGGGFAVAYQANFPAESDIEIGRFSSAGGFLGTIVVDSSPVNDDTDVSVAGLVTGDVAIAWTRTDPNNGDTDIFYAIYGSNGSTVKAPTLLTTSGSINRNASIVATATGFAVAYETNRTFSGSIDIVLAQIDAFGTVQQQAAVTNLLFFQIGEPDGSDETNPYLSVARDGNLAVSYTQTLSGNSDTIISTIAGTTVTASTPIAVPNSTNQQINSAVTYFGDGQLAIFHTDTTLNDIQGEHLSGFRDTFSDDANDTYSGDDFEDLINGTGGDDTLNGLRNNDFLQGGEGSDTLRGGEGNDTLVGEDGVEGTPGGNDRLFGENGADSLSGEIGNDSLYGGLGGDIHDGGDGFDYARYDDANYGNLRISLVAAATNTGTAAAGDTYTGIEGVIAGAGNDVIYGNGVFNILDGKGGNDTLFGGLGGDSLRGGDGIDFARYDDANYGNLVLSLANPAQNSGTGAAGDLYNSIEGIIGGTANDRIGGNGFINFLFGGLGNDTIAGNDGNDTLNGGTGLDIFRFNTALNAATNRDTIQDFVAADDTIELDRSVFSNTLPLGTLSADRFTVGAAATDASDRIIYNQATGALFFDADGNGGAFAAVQFATLSTRPIITNADFQVIA